MARLKAKRKQQTQSAGSETTKLIRKTRQATRKHYSAEEKIRIVMEGVRGEEPVSAICRREGIRLSLCPATSWTSRRSRVLSYSAVSAECRSICGCTRRRMPPFSASRATTCRT